MITRAPGAIRRYLHNTRRRYLVYTRRCQWLRAAAAILLASAPPVGPAWANGAPALLVELDSMLRAGDRNTNEGVNPVVSVSGTGSTRIVLDFLELASNFTPLPGLKVRLCLNVVDNFGSWGEAGKIVSVHHLSQPFAEGNGKDWGLLPAERVRGAGAGVTWNCPTDTEIANSAANCSSGWSGGEFGPVIDSVLITNDTSGTVAFDLTAWINGNPGSVLRFLVKKDNDGAPGRIDFYSWEGAFAASQLFAAPRLLKTATVDEPPTLTCAAAPGA